MKLVSVFGVLFLMVVASFCGWCLYFNSAEIDFVDPNSAMADDASTEDSESSVRLSPEKRKAAGILLSEVVQKNLRQQNKVPGRLKYDDRRHVEVRSATGGIITTVRVNPGDQVNAGDVLIELNCPEVGSARADVLQRNSDLKLAVENRDWERKICEGLGRLSNAIRDRVPVERIKLEFQNVTLGKNRESLLSAYSDVLLAESLVNAAQESAKSGVVPGRLIEERVNSRDNSEAILLTALESLSFTANVSRRHADAEVEDAQRRLRISQQHVRTLVGQSAADESPGEKSDLSTSGSANHSDENLSLVQLLAPFAGTIERRSFSPSERVAAGDGLLTLADTSTLWVAADLREREWNALTLNPGDEILVESSSAEMVPIKALVHFVGREVDPSTNAIPLIAVVDNPDGRLRPGMFVRVTVPLADSRDALSIPESAVLEHDSQTFVFSPEENGTFRRIDIICGIRVGGFVEVISGLNAGQQIVSGGGFYLKSELLLEGEE